MNKTLLIFSILVSLAMRPVNAQSTYGSIIGTVKDSSGGALQNASVKLTNMDENTMREVTSKANGSYEFLNILPAHYSVSITAAGFETFTATNLLLVARQTLRADATLKLGQISQSVTVNDSEEGVVQTDSQVIQETFDPNQIQNLPSNVRANGNTSPYKLYSDSARSAVR